MPANIKDLLKNTQEIFMTDSAVNTLLDFERVLDELDLYSFDNWKQGELVEGPIHERYFVKCTFMWPYSKMPDPRGGKRLSEYDCDVNYSKDLFEHPGKVKSPIWLVEIIMPKKLMQDIERGALELESGTVDLDDIDQAYQTGADDDSVDQEDNIDAEQQQ